MLVSDVYNVVCYRLLEPQGLQLGVLTVNGFLVYFADVIVDFLRQTRISKVLVTQAIQFSVGQYMIPDRQVGVEDVLVSARYIPRTTAESLDNTMFRWKTQRGPVKVWHDDSLPIKTIELVPAPNWQGTLYQTNSLPPAQFISHDTPGTYYGVVNTNGAAVTRVSGPSFNFQDATWQGKVILINSLPYTIQTAVDADHMIITTDAGVQANAPYILVYPVIIPAADRNLTTYGPQIPTQTAFQLTDTIPLVPDTGVIYLTWGILAKIYSDNGELKDTQRAQYCAARYQEGVNLFRAALLEELDDGDTD